MSVVRAATPMFRAALALGFLCAAFACDDETSPGTPITLETIWPNQNGNSWEYLQTFRGFEGAHVPDTSAVYANAGDVPPAPDIADLLPLLDQPSTPGPVIEETRSWGLRFEDSTMTLSGVTAQNLVEFSDSTSTSVMSRAASRSSSTFLALLHRARPDLRERFPGVSGSAKADTFETIDPVVLVLHGGAWKKTSGWIGMYGDLDPELAWMYMDSTLTTGHRFMLQLIPSVVDDAFLHGLVRRTVAVETSVGSFEHALEIDYLIDFGVAQATEPLTGDPIGYFRVINYGKVLYALGTGPVAAYERILVSVAENLGTGLGDVSLELTEVSQVLTSQR